MFGFKQIDEPLISEEGVKDLEGGVLQSYQREKYPEKFRSKEKIQDGEDGNAEQFEKTSQKDNDAKPAVNNPKPGDLINFYELNKPFIDVTLGSQDTEVLPEYREFYPRATALHHLPATDLKKFCISKNNPQLFATIVQASDLFKQMELKEFMCFQDYKRLSKIRLRNYVYLLKMMTKIDPTIFPQVRTRLYQVKRLSEFLELGLEEFYTKLNTITQTEYDLSLEEVDGDEDGDDKKDDGKKDEAKEEEKKDEDLIDLEDKKEEDGEEAPENEEAKKEEKEDDDEYGSEGEEKNEDGEESDQEEKDEDSEFREFFEKSEINDSWERMHHVMLTREEEKWVLRAQFLEDFFDKIKQNNAQSGWQVWFQAKLDQLANLDIPIRNVTRSACSDIFYLHNFLEDYLFDQQSAKADKGKDKTETLDLYSRDEQIYIEEQNLYPKIKINYGYIDNSYHLFKSLFSVRDKLQIKIQKREIETDYIVTLYEKKPFGNDKIYEKRINTRGHTIDVERFELDPNGGNIYLAFKIKESGSIDLIFNTSAKHKKPLLIKPGSHFIGFYDKYFYAAKTVKILKEHLLDLQQNKPIQTFKKEVNQEPAIIVETQEEAKPAEEKVDDEEKQEDQEDQEEKAESNKEQSDKEDEEEEKSEDKEDKEEKDEGNEEDADKSDGEEKGEESEEDGDKQEESVKEEEVDDKYETIFRIYEYDLHDFNRIRTLDLIQPAYLSLSVENIQDKSFGKTNQGFYYFKTYTDEKTNMTKREFYLKQQLCKIDILDKVEQKDTLLFKISEKGDRILIIIKKEDQINIYLHAQETMSLLSKEKKFKCISEFKLLKEQLEVDLTQTYHVEAMDNDFIILIKDKANKVTIFQNDAIVATTSDLAIEQIKFICSENQIKSFYFIDPSIDDQISKNEIRFYMYEAQGDKKEWVRSSVQFDMINKSTCVCFPYVYFIYNHDQVYMKDLSQPDYKGYYYLNHFMGIEEGMRPLTISSYVYNNKVQLNIPIIFSSYTSTDYVIKVHQIKTFQTSTNPFKFSGTLRYRVFAYNQEFYNSFLGWSQFIQDPQRNLYTDVRIFYKNNCMHIEKWEKNRAKKRLIVTHYNEPLNTEERNLGEPRDQLGFKKRGFWLIITHDSDQIQVFTREMRCNFYLSDLIELEPIWDVADDDQNNLVYKIMVDTLVMGKVDLYLLYQNAQMKKFSATVPIDEGNNLQFEEHQHIYCLMESAPLKAAGASSGSANPDKKTQSASSGSKINLFEQAGSLDMFIANSIFYSNKIVIDLKAELLKGKNQTGVEIKNTHLMNIERLRVITYSFNEAKLAAIYKKSDLKADEYDDQGNKIEYYDNVLVLSPLINSRVIPQFYHGGFRHPVVPQLDRANGFVSVFTLNLTPIIFNYYGATGIDSSYERNMRMTFNDNFNFTPGILIKYFNGIEQTVPLKDQFLEISRFVQSQDGKYITIVGTRVNEYDQYNKGFEEGMFLYHFNVTEMKFLYKALFAQRPKMSYPQEVQDKINKLVKYTIKEIEPELDRVLEVGEFNNDECLTFMQGNESEYTHDVDLKTQDEEYLMKEWTKKYNTPKEEPLNKSITKKAAKEQIPLTNEEIEEIEKKKKEEEEKFEKDKQEDLEKIPLIDNLETPLKQFNIPYFQKKNGYYFKMHYKYLRENRIYSQTENEKKEEEEFEFDYDFEKILESGFSTNDQERINLIQGNMHLTMNENGHMFLINRLNNKLYFFYPYGQTYSFSTFKFNHDFQIYNADSSKDHIVVWSKSRYLILNVSSLLSNGMVQNIDQETLKLKDGMLVVDSNSEKVDLKKDSKLTAAEEYTYTIKDIKLKDSMLILKLEDNSATNYMKVLNFIEETTKFYIENNSILISGNKEYIWLLKENQVYDIERGFSTFFLWPGDQICTHGFDSMDVFNISDDKTIMITQGYLQLTFNMISYMIDNEINDDFKYEPKNANHFVATNWFFYMCYKISDYKSILERIFDQDYDKTSKEKFKNYDDVAVENNDEDEEDSDGYGNENSDGEESKKEASVQEEAQPVVESYEEKEKAAKLLEKQQSKTLQSMLSYFTYNFNPELVDNSHITNFFFTYYFNEKENWSGEPEIQNIFQKLFNVREERQELIQDILHYVADCKTVPVTHFQINKCFLNFLNNASSSLAFQLYLENVTGQTQQMKDTEKFQFKTTEDIKYMVAAHDTPVMDDKFVIKSKDEGETKKDVDITFLQLGNLLSEQGEFIMIQLSDKSNLKLMDIPFIKYLVMYQWIKVKDQIKKKLLYPFIAMLSLFSLYAVYFIDYSNSTTEEETTVGLVITIIFRWIIFVALFTVLTYFFYQEGKQFVKSPRDYFQSFWNLADLLNYTLILCVLLFEAISINRNIQRPVATLCFIVLWIKMFYFLRVFDSTSQLIRMIIEIVNDMKNFLTVLFIGIIGFAGGLYILQQGLDEGDPQFAGEDAFKAFIYTYRMALGDFQLDYFGDYESKTLYFEYYLVWAIFIIGSLFLVIVLMNLLIAIMGDTFSKVLESIANLNVREKVMLISENEALFSRKEIFKDAQFLIILNEKILEGAQAENWDGQINNLKRQLMDKVTKMETDLKNSMTEISRELRKKFQDSDEKAKKHTQTIEQKMQVALKNQQDIATAKLNEVLSIHENQMIAKFNSYAVDIKQEIRSQGDVNSSIYSLQSDFTKFSKVFYKHNNIDAKDIPNDEEDEY